MGADNIAGSIENRCFAPELINPGRALESMGQRLRGSVGR